MSKEGLSPYQAREKRIVFIEKAVGEGVLERIPVSERDQNIALVYILNQELSGKEVGKIFAKPSEKPLSKQRVDQISKRFLEQSHQHSSPQLQSFHPLSELLTRKPKPLSEVNARIKHIAEREDIDPKAIRDKEGVRALSFARKTLRNYGIQIPLMPTAYEDLKAKVKAEADDEKLQKILDGHTSLMYYVKRNRQDPERVFVSLSSVLKKAGFYPHRNNLAIFADKLNKKGIPIRSVNGSKPKKIYWIVLDKSRQRIIGALEGDPDLQKFKESPVQLICGDFEGKLPTIADLLNKGPSRKFGIGITKIIKEVTGCTVGKKEHKKVQDFLIGCPVPIFKYGNVYRYPTDKIAELKTFLVNAHSSSSNSVQKYAIA